VERFRRSGQLIQKALVNYTFRCLILFEIRRLGRYLLPEDPRVVVLVLFEGVLENGVGSRGNQPIKTLEAVLRPLRNYYQKSPNEFDEYVVIGRGKIVRLFL